MSRPGVALTWAVVILLCAIWGTIFIELVGPVLCFFRPTRRAGLVLIWLLAFLLGGCPRSLYFEFVGLFWMCSMFWVPPETLTRAAEDALAVPRRIGAWLAERGAPVPSERVARAGLFVLVLVAIGVTRLHDDNLDWQLYVWRVTAMIAVPTYCPLARLASA